MKSLLASRGATWGFFPRENVGIEGVGEGGGALFTNGPLVKFSRFQCLSIGKTNGAC